MNEYLRERLRRVWMQADLLTQRAADLFEEIGGDDSGRGRDQAGQAD